MTNRRTSRDGLHAQCGSRAFFSALHRFEICTDYRAMIIPIESSTFRGCLVRIRVKIGSNPFRPSSERGELRESFVSVYTDNRHFHNLEEDLKICQRRFATGVRWLGYFRFAHGPRRHAGVCVQCLH